MTEPEANTTAYRTRQRGQLRQRRYAQRVLVDGRLAHPDAPHGSPGGYQNWGCHCVRCTTANTADRKRWRKDDPAWTQAQRGRARGGDA